MNKLLEIHKNIVPLYLQDYLYNLITGQLHGKDFPLYSTTSMSDGNKPDFGFYNNFTTNKTHLETILQVLFFTCLYRKINLQNILLNRIFFQLPVKDVFIPPPHIDLPHEQHLVCLYYVNDSDGDTIFYDNNNNIIKKLKPEKGKLALFDGSIQHSAGVPTENERIVINICFKGEFYGK